MEYVPPFTSVDPDAPYINGNPGTGTEGSIPPAAAFEHPMREIVHAITQSGQTPAAGTLTQLWAAIKGTGTIGNPGYWKSPIGLIFQWDLVTLGTGNGDVVTLPIAFPNDIFLVVATDSGAGAHGLAWSRNGGSVSTFKGYGRDPVTAGAFITTAYGYIAIGC